jgi:hypothetical protein
MDSWVYEPTEDFDQDPVERLKKFPCVRSEQPHI